MKKLCLWLLLISAFCSAQTQTYATSNALFPNPGRGMYMHEGTQSSSHDPLSQSSMTSDRVNSNITLVLRIVYLDSFLTSNISPAFLTKIQTDFTSARAAGVKLIMRFAYSDGENPGSNNPTKTQILSHISQLAPVLEANKDVIACIQAGFIGAWGEWYYADYFGNAGTISVAQYADRKAVIDYMLTNFPDELQIQVRTPNIKQRITGTSVALTAATAYTSPYARLAHHNDSFLSSLNEQGTYQNTAEKTFVEAESDYTVVGGEANEYPTTYTNCTNTVASMSKYSYSYFNSVGYASGIINNWQTENTSSYPNGCLDEIKRRLGYRFELITSTLTPVSINVKLLNTGFSHLYDARTAYIVAINSTGQRTNIPITSDPRFWLKNTVVSVDVSLSALPAEIYSLYFWLPDANSNLQSRPEYSVRMANTGVWNAATGLNSLNQTLVVSSALCPQTVWNGSTWSAGVPTVLTTAVIDGPYTVLSGQGFDCCYLQVNSTLQINNNGFVTVLNDIDVANTGNLLVKSGGKLIPVSDTSTSTGNVTVERTTTQLKQYDYTYFGSPVTTGIENTFLPASWQMNHIFKATPQNYLDVETSYNGTFISNVPDGQDDSGDYWELATGNMAAAKGYAAMVKIGSIFPRTETVSFSGALHTGIVTLPLYFSQNPDTNNDWNVIANPYSSSIYAPQFINDNIDRISGTIFLWSHAGTLSASYPGLVALNFTDEYAYLNELGGTSSSFGGKTPGDYIASCQGFLVEAESNTLPITFKPSTMAAGYSNSTSSTFFREAGPAQKIWISIKNDDLYSQTLVGYSQGTTLGYEKGWDSKLLEGKNPLTFYSLQEGTKYKIQARGMLYSSNDVVPLGYKAEVAGTYTIALDSISGIQNVWLREGAQIHSLPHTFTTEAGEYNFRFELVYSQDLSLNQFLLDKIVLSPNPVDNMFSINLSDPDAYFYQIFDVAGRKIDFIRYQSDFYTDGLRPGVYFLVIRDNQNRKVLKILKN